MREYTVLNTKGKVELYSFEAENIEEAISIAQNDVDEYPNLILRYTTTPTQKTRIAVCSCLRMANKRQYTALKM